MARPSVLVDVCRSYVLEQDEQTSPEKLQVLESAVVDFLNGAATSPQVGATFRRTIGTSKPFDRIVAIVQTGDHPIPDFSSIAPSPAPAAHRHTRPWTEYETQRLLAGIHRFGTDEWSAVATFVGNGRTRSQCVQRWVRGLDPRISKDRWTKDDEGRLLSLVAKYGTRGWTKVAGELGNRSDVQCRYHWHQLKVQQASREAGIVPSTSVPLGLLLNGAQAKPLLPPIQNLLEPARTWKASVSLGALPIKRGGEG
jgi:hypothetical protein